MVTRTQTHVPIEPRLGRQKGSKVGATRCTSCLSCGRDEPDELGVASLMEF